MPDSPAVPPEAYEAAARAFDKAAYGHVDRTFDDGLNAAVDAVWSLGVAEGRRNAAEAIRAEVAKLGDVGHLHGWLEWAARIAEGNTEPHHDRPATTVPS